MPLTNRNNKKANNTSEFKDPSHLSTLPDDLMTITDGEGIMDFKDDEDLKSSNTNIPSEITEFPENIQTDPQIELAPSEELIFESKEEKVTASQESPIKSAKPFNPTLSKKTELGFKSNRGNHLQAFDKSTGQYTNFRKALKETEGKNQLSSSINIPLPLYHWSYNPDWAWARVGPILFDATKSGAHVTCKIDLINRQLVMDTSFGISARANILNIPLEIYEIAHLNLAVDLASFCAAAKAVLKADKTGISGEFGYEIGVCGPSTTLEGRLFKIQLCGINLEITGEGTAGYGLKQVAMASLNIDYKKMTGSASLKLGLFKGLGASGKLTANTRIDPEAIEALNEIHQRLTEHLHQECEDNVHNKSIAKKLETNQPLEPWESEDFDDMVTRSTIATLLDYFSPKDDRSHVSTIERQQRNQTEQRHLNLEGGATNNLHNVHKQNTIKPADQLHLRLLTDNVDRKWEDTPLQQTPEDILRVSFGSDLSENRLPTQPISTRNFSSSSQNTMPVVTHDEFPPWASLPEYQQSSQLPRVDDLSDGEKLPISSGHNPKLIMPEPEFPEYSSEYKTIRGADTIFQQLSDSENVSQSDSTINQAPYVKTSASKSPELTLPFEVQTIADDKLIDPTQFPSEVMIINLDKNRFKKDKDEPSSLIVDGEEEIKSNSESVIFHEALNPGKSTIPHSISPDATEIDLGTVPAQPHSLSNLDYQPVLQVRETFRSELKDGSAKNSTQVYFRSTDMDGNPAIHSGLQYQSQSGIKTDLSAAISSSGNSWTDINASMSGDVSIPSASGDTNFSSGAWANHGKGGLTAGFRAGIKTSNPIGMAIGAALLLPSIISTIVKGQPKDLPFLNNYDEDGKKLACMLKKCKSNKLSHHLRKQLDRQVTRCIESHLGDTSDEGRLRLANLAVIKHSLQFRPNDFHPKCLYKFEKVSEGDIHFYTNRYESCVKHINKYLSDGEYHKVLTLAHQFKKEFPYDGNPDQFLKIINNPEWLEAHTLGLLEQRKVQQAVKFQKYAFENCDRNGNFRLRFAEKAFHLGYYKLAKDCAEMVSEKHPHYKTKADRLWIAATVNRSTDRISIDEISKRFQSQPEEERGTFVNIADFCIDKRIKSFYTQKEIKNESKKVATQVVNEHDLDEIHKKHYEVLREFNKLDPESCPTTKLMTLPYVRENNETLLEIVGEQLGKLEHSHTQGVAINEDHNDLGFIANVQNLCVDFGSSASREKLEWSISILERIKQLNLPDELKARNHFAIADICRLDNSEKCIQELSSGLKFNPNNEKARRALDQRELQWAHLQYKRGHNYKAQEICQNLLDNRFESLTHDEKTIAHEICAYTEKNKPIKEQDHQYFIDHYNELPNKNKNKLSHEIFREFETKSIIDSEIIYRISTSQYENNPQNTAYFNSALGLAAEKGDISQIERMLLNASSSLDHNANQQHLKEEELYRLQECIDALCKNYDQNRNILENTKNGIIEILTRTSNTLDKYSGKSIFYQGGPIEDYREKLKNNILLKQNIAKISLIRGIDASKNAGFDRSQVLSFYADAHKKDPTNVDAAILLANEYSLRCEYRKADEVSKTAKVFNKNDKTALEALTEADNHRKLKQTHEQLFLLDICSCGFRETCKRLEKNKNLSVSARKNMRTALEVESVATPLIRYPLHSLGQKIISEQNKKVSDTHALSRWNSLVFVGNMGIKIASLANKHTDHQYQRQVNNILENSQITLDFATSAVISYQGYLSLKESGLLTKELSEFSTGELASLSENASQLIQLPLYISKIIDKSLLESWRKKGEAPTGIIWIVVEDFASVAKNQKFEIASNAAIIYKNKENIKGIAIGIANHLVAKPSVSKALVVVKSSANKALVVLKPIASKALVVANTLKGWISTVSAPIVSVVNAHPYVAVSAAVVAGACGTYRHVRNRRFNNHIHNAKTKVGLAITHLEINKRQEALVCLQKANEGVNGSLDISPDDTNALCLRDKISLVEACVNPSIKSCENVIAKCDTRIAHNPNDSDFRRIRHNACLQGLMLSDLPEEKRKKFIEDGRRGASQYLKQNPTDANALSQALQIERIDGKLRRALELIPLLRQHAPADRAENLNKEERSILNTMKQITDEMISHIQEGFRQEKDKELNSCEENKEPYPNEVFNDKQIAWREEKPYEWKGASWQPYCQEKGKNDLRKTPGHLIQQNGQWFKMGSTGLFSWLDDNLNTLTSLSNVIKEIYSKKAADNWRDSIISHIESMQQFFTGQKEQWMLTLRKRTEEAKKKAQDHSMAFSDVYHSTSKTIKSTIPTKTQYLSENKQAYEEIINKSELLNLENKSKVMQTVADESKKYIETIKTEIKPREVKLDKLKKNTPTYEDYAEARDTGLEKIDEKLELKVKESMKVLWATHLFELASHAIDLFLHTAIRIREEARTSNYVPLTHWPSEWAITRGPLPVSSIPNCNTTGHITSESLFSHVPSNDIPLTDWQSMRAMKKNTLSVSQPQESDASLASSCEISHQIPLKKGTFLNNIPPKEKLSFFSKQHQKSSFNQSLFRSQQQFCHSRPTFSQKPLKKTFSLRDVPPQRTPSLFSLRSQQQFCHSRPTLSQKPLKKTFSLRDVPPQRTPSLFSLRSQQQKTDKSLSNNFQARF